MKLLGVPTFARPGFEFGIGSSGFHGGISGSDFILVWNRIRSVFDAVGPDNWQNWFVPYFGQITGHAHLKAFTYISDPWDREGFWPEWATSLITPSTTASIRDGYAAEMDDPRYIHQPARPVPAVAPTQRLILFALLLMAGVSAVGWNRARG